LCRLKACAHQTDVADYTAHLPELRKLAESFLAKLNEHEGQVLLAPNKR
jgi:hypothetical protein